MTAAKDARPPVCHSCNAVVIWARWVGGDSNGKIVPIEECAEGEGRVSLQYPLIRGEGIKPTAQLANLPSKYRKHIDSCPQAQAWRDAWKTGKPERQYPRRKAAAADGAPRSFTGSTPARKKPT